MSRRTRPLLAAGAVAAAFLAFGSQPAMAQVDWAKRVQELKLESQLMQQGVSLMMDGRGLEAAEQMEQHMRSAGVTPTRLAQKCNYLEFAGEMGLFSDCVKAYRGLLVNGRIPPRQNEPTPAETAQSETDLVYFNLPRFYKTLGDYKSALEVGEAGLGFVKIRSIRFLLLEQVAGVHLKLGNRDKAQAILREVERWQPNAGEIVSRNAAMQNLSAALGDFDSALKYFDEIEKGAAPAPRRPRTSTAWEAVSSSRAIRPAIRNSPSPWVPARIGSATCSPDAPARRLPLLTEASPAPSVEVPPSRRARSSGFRAAPLPNRYFPASRRTCRCPSPTSA